MRVDTLDLRPGGTLTYTMTATGPEQIAFMQGAGLPLSTASTKTFTTVEPTRHLAYSTLADFIPASSRTTSSQTSSRARPPTAART